MYKDIIIGDYAIYNGLIPDNIGSFDKSYIKRRLKIGRGYKIVSIEKGLANRNIIWGEVEHNTSSVWVPIECFNKISNIEYIKEKYDLR